jgi:hypothetical protein
MNNTTREDHFGAFTDIPYRCYVDNGVFWFRHTNLKDRMFAAVIYNEQDRINIIDKCFKDYVCLAEYMRRTGEHLPKDDRIH